MAIIIIINNNNNNNNKLLLLIIIIVVVVSIINNNSIFLILYLTSVACYDNISYTLHQEAKKQSQVRKRIDHWQL